MTSRTDGTSTWTYTWDDDNRLTRVQGPGGVDVSYEYDSQGRMLTRDDGTTVTSFTWDGWDCVKEDDGTNVFRWYCPRGELFSFERNSTFYQVHTDALGSVRAITDNTGAVVGSYTYSAWGEILSASEPSGFTIPYKWVGAYGVRHDPATGLYYMRNRWYDAGLGRFVSRDPLGKHLFPNLDRSALNLYTYADNNPIQGQDPSGLYTITDELLDHLRQTYDVDLKYAYSFMQDCIKKAKERLMNASRRHRSHPYRWEMINRAIDLLTPGTQYEIGWSTILQTDHQGGVMGPGYGWSTTNGKSSVLTDSTINYLAKSCSTRKRKIDVCSSMLLHEMAHVVLFRYYPEMTEQEPFIKQSWEPWLDWPSYR